LHLRCLTSVILSEASFASGVEGARAIFRAL
jgi:hypothetical protein